MTHSIRLLRALCLSLALCHDASAQIQPNIIFITIDDLNDYVEGFDGHPQVETPNLYAFAQNGITFYNAYCSSPQCSPSRTSMLTGKDLYYTNVYDNDQYKLVFDDNFTYEEGNAVYYTLPGYFKDAGGYYTYSLNKIFHGYEEFSGYDASTSDPCEKLQAWNKAWVYEDSAYIIGYGTANNIGVKAPQISMLPDSVENLMMDKIMSDSAIAFLQAVAGGSDITCGKPFFLALGYKRPHVPLFIPEQYYSEHIMSDIYEVPLNLPYNVPYNAVPYNGIVMPPQPEPRWADYEELPFTARSFVSNVENNFTNYEAELDPYPIINVVFSAEEKTEAIKEAMRANTIMAYLAAIKYVDYHIGRVIESLESLPEIYNNTIVVIASDHGWGFGEKKHWGKAALWETDIRVPLIIADLRNIQTGISKQTVSLLDIFPTLCDLADLPEPLFSDSTRYLDGVSLEPIINNPSLHWVRPVLSSKENPRFKECSCFPQISVRDARFHYIRYQSNNAVPYSSSCDSATSIIQEELYDIGINRETDPYEWNNLAADSAYVPVKEYLHEFLPGGELYLQKAHKVVITNAPAPCLLSNTNILKLKSKLYTPDGNPVPPSLLANYTFTWTNNLNSETGTGPNYTFTMNTLPAAIYETGSRILFYLTVTDIATGKIAAFDTKTFYFNPANLPVISYSLEADGLTMQIVDYSISGSYTNTNWTFGDGSFSEEFLPAPYTYATAGSYMTTNVAYYGNKSTCKVNASQAIAVAKLSDETLSAIQVYPNPAQDKIFILLPSAMTGITLDITNVLGQKVYTKIFDAERESIEIQTAQLPAGTYFLSISSNGISCTEKLEISR